MRKSPDSHAGRGGIRRFGRLPQHENNVPCMILHDLPHMYQGFQPIRAFADKPELIIPGHGPLVQERLRPVAEGIVSLG